MNAPDDAATGRVDPVARAERRRHGPAIARQPRWRPVWFADVERDGELLELCVRGDRTDMPLIFPLDHEMRLQSLMHDHGIPTAKVYGWIDEPMAYVMDRVPGRNDFEQSTDEERRAVVDDYLQILARLHALDIAPFVDGGIMRAASPEESGTFGMSRYERVFRIAKTHPDPFIEFCLGWLRRNPPDRRGRESAIVWDSGPVPPQDGRDRRRARRRDRSHRRPDDGPRRRGACATRSSATATSPSSTTATARSPASRVDLDAIQRHHFAFTLTNQLAVRRGAARRPARVRPHDEPAVVLRDEPVRHRGAGRVSSTSSCRPSRCPTPRESRATPALEHLVAHAAPLETATTSTCATSCARCSGSPATSPRVDEIGDAVSRPTSTTCTSCSATAPTPGSRARPSSSGSCSPTPTTAATTRRCVVALPQAQPAGPDAARPGRFGDGPAPAHPDLPELEPGPGRPGCRVASGRGTPGHRFGQRRLQGPRLGPTAGRRVPVDQVAARGGSRRRPRPSSACSRRSISTSSTSSVSSVSSTSSSSSRSSDPPIASSSS